MNKDILLVCQLETPFWGVLTDDVIGSINFKGGRQIKIVVAFDNNDFDIDNVLKQIQPHKYKFLGVFASNYNLRFNE